MQLQQHFLDSDIAKKCKKYPQFRKELQELQKVYRDRLNMSLYSALDKVESQKVFQLQKQKPKDSFLYVHLYGYRMPASEADEERLSLLFIRVMDQVLRLKPQRKYIVICHHTLADSNYGFAFLNKLYKKLPLMYYALLEKIFVIDSSILIKSVGLFDFGRLHKVFSRRIEFIENWKKLKDFDYIVKDGVMELIPQQLLKAYTTGKDKEGATKESAILNLIANNVYGNTSTNKAPKMCTIKRDFMTIELNEHKFTSQGIPIALQILISTLREHSQYLRLQGIFRKNGSCQQEQQIINTLQKQVGQLTLTNPHPQNCPVLAQNQNFSGYSIAAVIKKFFTKLMTPIFPFPVYNKILKTTSISSQIQTMYVKDLLAQLPTKNHKVLLYITSFIKHEVIPLQEENKMNNYNMSVVFCPCFFRPQTPTLEDLMNSGKFAGILNVLFGNYDQIVQKQTHKRIGEQSYSPSPQGKKRGSRGSRGQRGSKGQRNSIGQA